MGEDAANVVARHVGQAGVPGFVVEQRRAVLPQRLVRVHAGAIVTGERLRHEGGGLAVQVRGLLDDVLEILNVIGRVQQGVEAVVDLLLAAGAHLVVEALQLEPGLLQVLRHLVAQLDRLVVRCDGEIAALQAVLVAQIAEAIRRGLRAAVPPALVGINRVELCVRVRLVAHRIEDVELGLRAEVAGIGDVRRDQVLLGLARDVARIAGERLQGERIVDEELHVQRLGRAELVDARSLHIRQKGHVGFFDSGKSTNRRTVESEAFLRSVLGELGGRDGEVVLAAGDVREPDIDELHVFIGDEFDDVLDGFEGHNGSLRGVAEMLLSLGY